MERIETGVKQRVTVHLKQFTPRHVGSTWMKTLLADNLDVTVSERDGYKHTHPREDDEKDFPPDLDAYDGVLATFRHPHAWLVNVSYTRQEPEPIQDGKLRHYIHELYAFKTHTYLDLVQEKGGLVWRYEDVLPDPEQAVLDAADGLGVEAPTGNVNVHPRRVDDLPDRIQARRNPGESAADVNRRYYLDKLYYDDLPKRHFEQFNRHVRLSVGTSFLERLGYELTGPR